MKDIADKTIPKTSVVPKRFNKPWLSDICKDAIKQCNGPSRGSNENHQRVTYRIARAKARRDTRHSEKTRKRMSPRGIFQYRLNLY